MSAPKVTIREQDLSSYVKSDNNLGVAMAVPLKFGSLDPILVTNKQDFLDKCTPNGRIDINMSSSHHSALLLTKNTNSLFVLRVISEDAKSACFRLTIDNMNLTTKGVGIGKTPKVENIDKAVLYAENPGVWANDLSISIVGYKEQENTPMEKYIGIDNDGNTVYETLYYHTDEFYPDGFQVYVLGSADTKYSQDYLFTVKNEWDPSYKGKKNTICLYDKEDKIVRLRSFQDNVTIIPANVHTKTPGTYCLRIHKGVNKDVVESYIVSMTPGTKDKDGMNIFIDEALESSLYVRCVSNMLNANEKFAEFVIPKPFSGGTDGSPVTTGDYIRAIDKVSNSKSYNITIYDDGGYSSIPYHKHLFEICETRGDSVAVLSMPYELQVNRHNTVLSQINWLNGSANYNTSYGTISSSHQLYYDEFNDRYLYIGSSVFTTVNIIQCNANYQIWYPAAGSKRGKVNSIDCKIRYTEGEEGLLYDNRINPIMFEVGRGIKVNGQLTLLRSNSMLTHLHVRLMLCRVKPEIKELLRDYLHDLNIDNVLESIATKLNSYFSSLVDLKAIRKYSVSVVSSDRDKDEFKARVRIMICPVSSIDEIPVDLGITNNTISLELAESLLA